MAESLRVRFGDYELDEARNELRRRGSRVELQPKPLQLLFYLARNRDRVVPKDELLQNLWPDAIVTDTSLANALSQMRQALGDDGAAQRVIRTLKGRGYRFLSEVEPLPAVATSEHEAEAGSDVSQALPTPLRSLAVLPLENLSGDPEQEYFVDGLTETLISDLARISALRVRSRTSVMQYKRARKPLTEIAKELGVDAVIEGTVIRAGDRVRISVKLIDAGSDRHLWSERFDRDLRDILSIHSDVARAVSEQIRLELTPHEEAHFQRTRVVDPEALDAYLRGILHLARATVPDAYKAIEHFETALERDPEYALAYAGIARSYLYLGYGLSSIPPRDAVPRLRAAAEKALDLDPSLAFAHAMLGTVLGYHDWDWRMGEAEMRRAVELSPSDPQSLGEYAHFLSLVGRHDEALRLYQRTLSLEPIGLWRGFYLIGFFLAGNYERTVEECVETLELEPDSGWAHNFLGWSHLALEQEEDAYSAFARVHELTGRDEEWLREWERAFRQSGVQGAVRHWMATDTEREKTEYVGPIALILGHQYLGNADATFAWLERARDERLYLAFGLRCVRDSLRSDPRFDDLLRRIGFPQNSGTPDA
ncbi:MAG: winged helix-turn-helix domain-containing protein [Myxococcota bacterium]